MFRSRLQTPIGRDVYACFHALVPSQKEQETQSERGINACGVSRYLSPAIFLRDGEILGLISLARLPVSTQALLFSLSVVCGSCETRERGNIGVAAISQTPFVAALNAA